MATRWNVNDIPDQTGRVVVVTGANAGLGLEVAAQLAAAGAWVVMACRNASKAHAAADRLRGRELRGALVVAPLDLADLASVEAFAVKFAADFDRLDLLVNNAGVMAVDQSRTVDGFETQFGVNHLGHFALTMRLLPVLVQTPDSRVSTMSSMGHRAGRLVADDVMFDRRGYQRWSAYYQSKLANLLFTAELNVRLRVTGAPTTAVAAHPGASRTDLGTEGRSLSNRLMSSVVPLVTQPASVGALPMLRAVTDPGVRGGKFYGPRWLVRGAPVLEIPSRAARDLEDAALLWDMSESLTGVEMPKVEPTPAGTHDIGMT